jgi:hypothetical protein
MFRRALGLKHCMIKSITMRLQIGAGMKRFGFCNNSSQERHHSSATSMISQQLHKQNRRKSAHQRESQKTFDATVAIANGWPAGTERLKLATVDQSAARWYRIRTRCSASKLVANGQGHITGSRQ